jgi:ABC-type multidrug transport system fused ATPase/permease subunit
LTGGQKARVSLARAVYSRASTLLLDDIISALDAHTTQAIVTDCFQGELMRDRTVILVSHSIKVLAPAASYVVLLDNGDVKFTGDTAAFVSGGHMDELDEPVDPASPENEKTLIDLGDDKEAQPGPSTNVTDSETTTLADPKTEEDSGEPPAVVERKTPRKLVEDEVRQTGTIAWKTWKTYLAAQGSWTYWIVFSIAVLIGATPPVWENYILNRWSDSYSHPKDSPSPAYFFTIYAIATLAGTLVSQMRFGFLYYGSLQASQKIHKTMLERVLFATVRFHDTSVRGR